MPRRQPRKWRYQCVLCGKRTVESLRLHEQAQHGERGVCKLCVRRSLADLFDSPGHAHDLERLSRQLSSGFLKHGK